MEKEKVVINEVLKVEDLRTYFYSYAKEAFIRSVDSVSFSIRKGEVLGIVGESGCGKSITAQSVMGLITDGPGIISGSILLTHNGKAINLLEGLSDYVSVKTKRKAILEITKDVAGWLKRSEILIKGIRGKVISMIFQNPKSALNPFITVGDQIAESIMLHSSISAKKEAIDAAAKWLERVQIDSPSMRLYDYPFGLSGGMCQRVMIAMALSSEPALLIADEPTTGLDVTIQTKIIELLKQLKEELNLTILLITHDMSVIMQLADRIAVMYGGRIVEYGLKREIMDSNSFIRHPYTIALLNSQPTVEEIKMKERLRAIKGDVPDTITLYRGCRFYERCDLKNDRVKKKCKEAEPEMIEIGTGHYMRCYLAEG